MTCLLDEHRQTCTYIFIGQSPQTHWVACSSEFHGGLDQGKQTSRKPDIFAK